jgi:hypothetical protein
VSSAFEKARARFAGQRLDEHLEQHGPLALDLCLRHATGIATALRELHDDGRTHGSVDPRHVLLRASGATLLGSERRGYPDALQDLTGFGAVLYAMLTGKKPSGDEFRVVPAKPSILKGPASVRAAATRLAERCLTADRDSAPDFQKILTEVRLLSVMAKQIAADPAGVHLPPPPPVKTFPAPLPLEVYAGKAAPVIQPPTAEPPNAAPGAPLPPPDGATPAAPKSPEAPESADGTPGDDSPPTRRAKGSHSRPVLADVACPKCKGYHVRLSRPRTRFERFLSLLGLGVHRCHRCFYRYIPLLGRKIVRKSG